MVAAVAAAAVAVVVEAVAVENNQSQRIPILALMDTSLGQMATATGSLENNLMG